MTNFIKNFWNDEEGATAIEYGLIAGLIAVAIIAGVAALGKNLDQIFCEISTKLTANNTTATNTCAAK